MKPNAVQSGHLCLPVETNRAYTLTQDECENRMFQMRLTQHVHAVCYSNESWLLRDEEVVIYEREWPMVIAPSN